MTRRSLFTLLAFVAALFALPATAAADSSPEAFVKSKQAELNALLKKGKSADTDKKVEAIFDDMLDYESLAKESLAKHWDDRSDEEKKEFQTVLKRLVRNAYRKNLKKTLDYDIKFKGETAAKKGVLVRTVAKSKTNSREEPISIDYVVHKVNGKWRVKDIVTEGSSLVRNYQSQFGRVIKKKGFAELMKRMKKKLDKDDA